ncbi:MAG: PEP-utilizing enzyme, partial [Tepidiformaceae bacterium]
MTETIEDAFRLPDPAMEQGIWLQDAMHCPRPLTALGEEVWQTWMTTGLEALGGGLSGTIVNGYSYMGFAGPPPMGPLGRAGAESPRARWEGERLPHIRDLNARLRAIDYDALGAHELAAGLPGWIAETAGAFALTMASAGEVADAGGPLLDFCEVHWPEDGTVRAMTLVQGFANESSDAGAGLGRLAMLARDNGALVAALEAGDLAAVAAAPGGEAFVAEFDAFVADHGRGTTTWSNVHEPTWEEDPAVPLAMIARMARGAETAGSRHTSSANAREAARAAARASLGDEATIEEFDRLLAFASDYVPVIEGRARWQLSTIALNRLPVLALGRKLVAAGALERPDDAFHLTTAELKAAAKSGASQEALVEQRRAQHERSSALVPPRFLGLPVPAEVLAAVPILRRLTGIRAQGQPAPNVVEGIAASRGSARGAARVITRLQDADRLEPGDVLVCRFTAPPWTPLFSIAAAVVTDAGGVLSHAAIAAREYAIPCVSGTGDGTRRIPDGATVTVDGTQGLVRIE